jgi:heme exporter protein CcmD
VTFIDLPHIGFVIAAYAICALVIAGLIGATVLDYRVLRRALAAYEGGQLATRGEDE